MDNQLQYSQKLAQYEQEITQYEQNLLQYKQFMYDIIQNLTDTDLAKFSNLLNNMNDETLKLSGSNSLSSRDN